MKLTAHSEQWPLAEVFTISRGSRTHAGVMVAMLEADGIIGRGESTPYARYGESLEKSRQELDAAAIALRAGAPISALLSTLPPGATRNALDAAWWDLRCKQAGQRINQLLNLPPLQSLTTAYTLSIDTPERMEVTARAHAHRPLLKIKTGSEGVIACVEAVRRGAPTCALLVDANEAWRPNEVPHLLDAMATLGVRYVEQPLPAGEDSLLAKIHRSVPVIADESVHVAVGLADLRDRYDGVNLKLDKTGGLTEALHAKEVAQAHGMLLMCGCMLGTSLAMAPAMVLAQGADVVDLDAPLLLAEDRIQGISYRDSAMLPYSASLWG